MVGNSSQEYRSDYNRSDLQRCSSAHYRGELQEHENEKDKGGSGPETSRAKKKRERRARRQLATIGASQTRTKVTSSLNRTGVCWVGVTGLGGRATGLLEVSSIP